MVTNNEDVNPTLTALERLLMRGSRNLPAEMWEPGELSRRGVEALLREVEGDARRKYSSGVLRLFGQGVVSNSVPLNTLSKITNAWQRAVTSIGASLEGVRSASGNFPASIVERTELNLVASPARGSVVLALEAAQEPLDEIHGFGKNSLFGEDRALIDRSADLLLSLLDFPLEPGDHHSEAALALQLRDVGPRATGAISNLAQALHSTNVDLDARWDVPELPSHRITLTSDQARGLNRFIAGHELDATRETIQGRSVTVSTSERWLIEDGEKQYRVLPGKLGTKVRESVRPNMYVELVVLKRSVARPDGTFKNQYEAIELLGMTSER